MNILVVPVDWFRWVGPIVMLIVIAVGVYTIVTQYQSLHGSISSSIARNRTLYVLMGILLSIGGTLFYCFLAFWLIPYYKVSPLSYLLLICAFVAQLGMAWIPAHKTNKTLDRWHTYSGAGVAFCMLLFTILIQISASNMHPALAVAVTIFNGASIIYATFFLTFKKYRFRYFLLFEAFFIGGFAVITGLLALVA